jgi:hypothetical protein
MRISFLFIALCSIFMIACGGGKPAFEYNTLAEVCTAADTLCKKETTVEFEIVEVPVYYPDCHIAGNFPTVHFAPNDASVSGASLSRIIACARTLVKCEIPVLLIGHCDERLTNEYNYELGLARAKAVKTALVQYGVNPYMINVESRGESQAIADCHSEECWKLNRRVDIVVNGELFEAGE